LLIKTKEVNCQGRKNPLAGNPSWQKQMENIKTSIRKKEEVVEETVKEFDPETVFWAFDKLFSNAFPAIAILSAVYIIYHIWILLN
jgi:hypothetical protein